MDEPTAAHRRLLNAIWASYRREQQWPRYIGIDQLLDREGLNAHDLIASMPPGLMVPDVQRSPHLYQPDPTDQLRVKVPGLRYCDDTESEMRLAARLVRYIADREQAFVMPSLSEPTALIVTSDEARRDLSLSDAEVARAWALLTTFETRLWGGGGNPEQWSLNIDIAEARRYRNVETPDDYIAARADLDRPPERAKPAITIAPSDELLVVAPDRQTRSFRVLAPVLSHPIVSGLIVGLILLAVGLVIGR